MQRREHPLAGLEKYYSFLNELHTNRNVRMPGLYTNKQLREYHNAFEDQKNKLLILQKKIEILVKGIEEDFFKTQLKKIWASALKQLNSMIEDQIRKNSEDSNFKNKYEHFFGENNIFELLITMHGSINLFEQNYKEDINYHLFILAIKNLSEKLVDEIVTETRDYFYPERFKAHQHIVKNVNVLVDVYNKNVNSGEEIMLVKLRALNTFKKQTSDCLPVVNFLRAMGSIVLSSIVTVLFAASAAIWLPIATLSCNGKLCGEIFTMVGNAVLYGPKVFNIPTLSTLKAYTLFQRTPVDRLVQQVIQTGKMTARNI